MLKTISLALLLAWTQALGASPKAVGYLRVLEGTPIHHGASDSSAVEATVRAGDVYELVSDKLNHGFYKIDYNGHVSYIDAGRVVLLNADGSPVPTPKATAVEEEEDDDKATPTPKPSPTIRKTVESEQVPTAMVTAGQVFGPYRPTPTAGPTLQPTAGPTIEPTQGPTFRPTEHPRHEPTRHPTFKPTERPTVEATERPTLEPTERPTVEPTERPTLEPTERPTVEPTQRPTPRPTERPTVEPTQRPTPRPTERPTPRPTPQPTARPAVITPATARGTRRVPVSQGSRPARAGSSSLGLTSSYTAISMGGNAGAAGTFRQRAPGHLDALELVLPVGMGKHQALVQPPYRQNAAVDAQRPIEFAAFVGLGLEYRVLPPVRLEFDWIAHSHRTKAADLGIPALKVEVPGSPATTQFDESEAYYRVNTQQVRLGLKLSYPHPVVEPWIDATYGLWAWTAELSDLNREITYGEASGVAFGGTLGLGVDFHGSFGGGLGWTITPFVEWGAPQLEPTIVDIAGLGVDWKDSFGTPAAIPARAGIQFGIGF